MAAGRQLARWMVPPGILAIMRRMKARINRQRKRNGQDRKLLRELLTLRDRHSGQRCFILGAGSSIKQQDLAKLCGEVVLSVSNTFVHPQFGEFRPKYHFVPPIVASHGHLYPQQRFVEWLRDMEVSTHDAEMFFHIGDRLWIEKEGLFSKRIVHWVDFHGWEGEAFDTIDLADLPAIWSVSELVISAAIYMGFGKIYLVGIDHDWFNGPLIYFYNPDTDHKVRPTKDALAFADAEFQMRRHADIFRKYKMLQSIHRGIFNANADPNHYMDVFPKADYASLFGAVLDSTKLKDTVTDKE